MLSTVLYFTTSSCWMGFNYVSFNDWLNSRCHFMLNSQISFQIVWLLFDLCDNSNYWPINVTYYGCLGDCNEGVCISIVRPIFFQGRTDLGKWSRIYLYSHVWLYSAEVYQVSSTDLAAVKKIIIWITQQTHFSWRTVLAECAWWPWETCLAWYFEEVVNKYTFLLPMTDNLLLLSI